MNLILSLILNLILNLMVGLILNLVVNLIVVLIMSLVMFRHLWLMAKGSWLLSNTNRTNINLSRIREILMVHGSWIRVHD